jgi:hypothetical protein
MVYHNLVSREMNSWQISKVISMNLVILKTVCITESIVYPLSAGR